ncbi:UxaA family hydrolase [Natrialbaceae archaeon AArc-T1-2]|uniref:UxaA family hydrolase n=1 Tax=Natrialbaceae archaeon AArc-T1-2 TaxID=3053904 RepID=UPI00255ABC33|nr:UxaA family hydrolase [Natrialbaceae archaeon AArc-T1-2]WIV67029.1 UxaA family hydrolase [Natrialbaceae archaeon AArc-T1-2]
MAEQYIEVVTPEDNVGTFIREVEEGEVVDVPVGDEVRTVTVNEDIPFGHKVALTDIDEGDTVCKYGLSIGYASQDIEAGDWVHTHNVDSNYGRGDQSDSEAIEGISE